MDPHVFSISVPAIVHGVLAVLGVVVAMVAILVIVLFGPWLPWQLDAQTAIEAGVVLPSTWAIRRDTCRPRTSRRSARRLTRSLRSFCGRQTRCPHAFCCTDGRQVVGDEEV